MAKMRIPFLILILSVTLSFQECLNAYLQEMSEGDTKDDTCIRLRCTRVGSSIEWVPDPDYTNKKCKWCTAETDPHYTAFSGARFDWHGEAAGGCNYALVQGGDTTNPNIGVFMDLTRVGAVAHIGPTVYKDDARTKVELSPGPLDKTVDIYKVKVNGQDRQISSTTPTLLPGTKVFAWKHDTCLRLHGKRLILVELCKSRIKIWAPVKTAERPVHYGGLCGSTDSKDLQEKKLVARDGYKYADPQGWIVDPDHRFGHSWKVREEDQRPECLPSDGSQKGKRSTRNQRSVNAGHQQKRKDCALEAKDIRSKFHNVCNETHPDTHLVPESDEVNHVGTCIFDCCIVDKSEAHKALNITSQHMIEGHEEIHRRNKFHNMHSIDFAPAKKLESPAGICGVRKFDGHPHPNTPSGADPNTKYGEFPWMVAVFRPSYDDYMDFVAAGSLVHPRFVLTEARRMRIGIVASIGAWDISWNISDDAVQAINVEKVIKHPEYDGYTLENDIALLLLDRPAILGETVMPICLPEPKQLVYVEGCIVTGWEEQWDTRYGGGHPFHSGESSKVLNAVVVPAVRSTECNIEKVIKRNGNIIDHSHYCAGEDGDHCGIIEDGSPLVCPKADNPDEYVQMGVYSFSRDCEGYGIYVSVPAASNWIHATINAEDKDSPYCQLLDDAITCEDLSVKEQCPKHCNIDVAWCRLMDASTDCEDTYVKDHCPELCTIA